MNAELIPIEALPPVVADYLRGLQSKFAQGLLRVTIVEGPNQVVDLLSPTESKAQLVRRMAEQWVAHPDALEDLKRSFEEKPEIW